MVYSIIRTLNSKEDAEKYRHARNAKNAQYGIGLPKRGSEWTLVRDYGMDGMLVKQFIPGKMSDEDRELLKESIWIEAPYSAYDCTGALFSNRITLYDVPGGTWVYHSIGRDI